MHRQILFLLMVISLGACSAPPPPRPRTRILPPRPRAAERPRTTRAPVSPASDAPAAEKTEAPDSPADPIEDYISRHPNLTEQVRRALRDRALLAGAAGMTQEETFLIVPSSAVRFYGTETVVKMDGLMLTFFTDRWDVAPGQRWRRLYFDHHGKRLRAWVTWNGQLEVFD